MPALQTLTVRSFSGKQTHPGILVDTEPEMKHLCQSDEQLQPLEVDTFLILPQWPAGSAGLIPASPAKAFGKHGLDFRKKSTREEIGWKKPLLRLTALGLTLDVSIFGLVSLASQWRKSGCG